MQGSESAPAMCARRTTALPASATVPHPAGGADLGLDEGPLARIGPQTEAARVERQQVRSLASAQCS